jgi:hypothetical protein
VLFTLIIIYLSLLACNACIGKSTYHHDVTANSRWLLHIQAVSSRCVHAT